MKTINLDKLEPKKRQAVERALAKQYRDVMLAIRVPIANREAYKHAADKAGEYLNDWAQKVLDQAAGVKQPGGSK